MVEFLCNASGMNGLDGFDLLEWAGIKYPDTVEDFEAFRDAIFKDGDELQILKSHCSSVYLEVLDEDDPEVPGYSDSYYRIEAIDPYELKIEIRDYVKKMLAESENKQFLYLLPSYVHKN